MLAFASRRILQTVPTVLAVVLLIFVLFSVIPGSIISSLSDDGRGPMDVQVVERMKKELGLDDPRPRPLHVLHLGKLAHRRSRHVVPHPRAGDDRCSPSACGRRCS